MKAINILLVAIGAGVVGKAALEVSQIISTRRESERLLLEAIKNHQYSVTIDENGNRIAVFADFQKN